MNPPVPAPRLRILLGREIAIGPGKAELLRLIEEMGSISAAAREMGMSYRRAWTLVETMNGAFRELWWRRRSAVAAAAAPRWSISAARCSTAIV